MSGVRLIILVLVALSLEGLAKPALAVLTRGAGGSGCGEWVEARRNGTAGTPSAINMEGWLLGFLSGTAYSSGKDSLRNTDPSSLFLWMDNYCKANPLSKVLDGAEQLNFELVDKLKKPK
jgi:hypothetical protein